MTETINGTTQTFSYDATNQLTNDNGTGHSYDLNGNRTDAGYVTDPVNRLRTDGIWNFTYDTEGNLIRKVRIATGENWNFAYDNLNHMVSAEQRDGSNNLLQRLTFVYDVFGNRIEKDVTVGASTTVQRFAYDEQNAWADLNGSNALQTRRLYLNAVDQLFARLGAGGTAWYLTDYQGSVRDLTDATGALRDHLTYDGFGNVLTET